jgi:hypothetical protein
MASREFLIRGAVAALIVALLAPGAEGAGPWKGRIVEQETGQPIADAVVLAIWTLRSWGEIHPHDEFHSAFETVSDADGRFVIPEHTAVPPKPLSAIRGPQIVIFKGGFGPWSVQTGSRDLPAVSRWEHDQRIKRGWEAFEKEGTVFELRRLADGRERDNWLGSVRPLSVPDDRMPRILQALEDETLFLRRSLGPNPGPRGQR